MRAQSSPRPIVSGLFTVSAFLILFTAVGSPPGGTAQGRRNAAPAVQCPDQTVMQDGQCVLTAVTRLNKTLRLAPGTTLNCKGHRLIPKRIGSDLSIRSEPEVAIFLNGVDSVRIRNCVIEGFDFGIFAIKSKVPAEIREDPVQLEARRNSIFRNNVTARFLAISLASVDNTDINDNTVKYTTAGGKGIYVGRDSDLNRIRANRITADIASNFTQAVGAPGPVSTSSNPVVSAGQAVLITQILNPDPTLLNAIIEGELFQLPIANSPVPNKDFSEGNVVQANTIVFTTCAAFDGIVIAIAEGTVVSGNIVRSAANSIRVGIQSSAAGVSKKFPGKCTNPEGRFCLADADCNILGTTGSTCSNPPTVPVFWVSDGTLIIGNTVLGPFNGGISTSGRNTIIRNNTITGPLSPLAQPGTGQGINLVAKFALETTTVTGNVVSNVATALALNNTPTQVPDLPASDFGALVGLNDFTGYTTSVRSDIKAELSANGRGNFWGLRCPLAFDPTKVQRLKSDIDVTDARPYGVPVAKTVAGSLPKPCR